MEERGRNGKERGGRKMEIRLFVLGIAREIKRERGERRENIKSDKIGRQRKRQERKRKILKASK